VKRRAIWLVIAAFVAWLVVANSGSGRTASANWREPRLVTANAGFAAWYPRSWHAFALGPNSESLVVASFPIPRDWPSRQHKRVPDRGIYIWVFTYGWLPQSRLFPPRPSDFALLPRDHGFYECGFGLEGYAVRFRERGMAMQAMVALGRGARPGDAVAVLDRLVVSGVPPSLARS
jgi:hypothetical protein